MSIADSQDRPDIEHTRRELQNFLAQGDRKPLTAAQRAVATAASAANGANAGNAFATSSAPESSSGFQWASLLEAGFASWWHAHPARAGALLLRSATEEYARKKPCQAMVVAATAGAALVLFRPWRLVSASALLFSVLRASNFTGMATSVLETAAQSLHKESP